jgi:hypothetical protein
MDPIVLRKREADGAYTSVEVSKNNVGITITTTKPGKRPKTDVEGLGALKVPEQDRINEIVGSYMAQGYFSEMLDAAQEPLDFYTAQFLDMNAVNAFLIDVRQSGLVMKDVPGPSGLDLEFDGFVAAVKNNFKGVQVTTYVPQRQRHQVVPVFYAMSARAVEVAATDAEANAFDVKEAFRLEHRTGKVPVEAISLLCNLDLIAKPLPPPAPKAGRVAFSMSL